MKTRMIYQMRSPLCMEKAGKQFKEIWSSHIGYFVDYVQATAKKDEAGKKKAVKELDQYRMKQADMLDKATDGRLKASELEEGLKCTSMNC